MIDSHCHLDHEPLFSNILDVLKRSKENGIKKILTICTTINGFSNIKDILKVDDIIYGTFGIHPHETETNVVDKSTIVKNINNLRNYIDEQKLNSYINFIVNALFDANKYFNDQEPWKKKNDKKRLNTIVFVALELIRKISIMLYPIVPSSAIKSLSIFNINEKDISFETIKDHKYLKTNSKISKVEILFKKIIK